MWEYEDPRKHLEEHMDGAAQKYVEGLEKAGLRSNDKLTRAMAGRALKDAHEDYVQHATQVHHHNIGTIIREHRREMNEIKRSGAKLRLLTCPPIALVFGLIAWHNFTGPYSDGFLVGMIAVFGALAFLAMLVGGAIFDRPTGE